MDRISEARAFDLKEADCKARAEEAWNVSNAFMEISQKWADRAQCYEDMAEFYNKSAWLAFERSK